MCVLGWWWTWMLQVLVIPLPWSAVLLQDGVCAGLLWFGVVWGLAAGSQYIMCCYCLYDFLLMWLGLMQDAIHDEYACCYHTVNDDELNSCQPFPCCWVFLFCRFSTIVWTWCWMQDESWWTTWLLWFAPAVMFSWYTAAVETWCRHAILFHDIACHECVLLEWNVIDVRLNRIKLLCMLLLDWYGVW